MRRRVAAGAAPGYHWGMSSSQPRRSAVVVGSGPNGLAAALTLAEAGVAVRVLEARSSLGGGTRTEELTVPGLRHDVCSAFHPLAAVSPFFARAGLERYGLTWGRAPVDLVHVLDGGRSASLLRDLDATVAGLGIDGPAWRRLAEPLTDRVEELLDDLFRPLPHVPRHPVTLARFGLSAVQPVTTFARRWRTPEAQALFAGLAAHSMGRLDRPLSSAVGVVFAAVTHRAGWPVAIGGSAAITAALAARLRDLGASLETDAEVTSLADVGDPDVLVLDLSPTAAARLLAGRLPRRQARAYGRYRYGPAALKIDYAVRGGVPWAAPAARRAGTVHVGGTLAEVEQAERLTVEGRLAPNPFTLVGQQYLADPSRSVGEVHPVWVYGHVPHAYPGGSGDAGAAVEAIEAQLERFAPGFAGRAVARHVATPADIEAGNANDVGGDIACGAADGLQSVLRPGALPDPYATGVPGVRLCSAATPPGPGVHGMGGLNAARRALADLQDGRVFTRVR